MSSHSVTPNPRLRLSAAPPASTVEEGRAGPLALRTTWLQRGALGRLLVVLPALGVLAALGVALQRLPGAA